MLNLPVQSLEYNDIRQSFVEFLKGQTAYRDFNFDASGIATQLNLMAYNSHLLGFFVKMLLDESFTDSAHTREALYSHAKKTAYIPRGRRSARAEVELKISMDESEVPLNDLVLVPRGSSFTSANSIQDTRVFQLPDDVLAKTRTQVGSTVTYSTGPIIAYEGKLLDWRFLVDSSVQNQKFVIKDRNVDIDTLRVFVKASPTATESVAYQRAQYADDIANTNEVYYITTNEDGFYQVFFGADVFGKQPVNGNEIYVTYVATNGLSGNGGKNFSFNPTGPDLTNDYSVGNFSDFEVITHSPSSGGMEQETIESLRFTIPNHYRRQNRLVSEPDYKSILLEEFRSIDSINVWGGEKSKRRDYGKVYCSIKPKNALYLTGAAKKEIKDRILNVYGVVAGDIVFVDPEYIDVAVQVIATIDKSKTNSNATDIESLITTRIANYNANTLNRFSSFLSDQDMLNAARAGDRYIASLYSFKTLSKSATVIYGSTGTNQVDYANPLRAATLSSTEFTYGGKTCKFKDEGGNLYIYADGAKMLAQSFGSVDYAAGTIEFRFPEFARVPGFTGQSGRLRFTADAVNPDVATELNNIVRITQTRVQFK